MYHSVDDTEPYDSHQTDTNTRILIELIECHKTMLCFSPISSQKSGIEGRTIQSWCCGKCDIKGCYLFRERRYIGCGCYPKYIEHHTDQSDHKCSPQECLLMMSTKEIDDKKCSIWEHCQIECVERCDRQKYCHDCHHAIISHQTHLKCLFDKINIPHKQCRCK